MNLRKLAYFVLTCQQNSLASAAAELGITQSTLSVALKDLADQVGLPLFEHVQRRLHLTAAGLWLFRTALPLLHAESFARGWVPHPGPAKPHYLLVEVRLSFALGRVTKAISAAIEQMQARWPDTFIELHFSGAGLNGNDTVPLGSSLAALAARTVVIDAVSSAPGRQSHAAGRTTTALSEDEWVFVHAREGAAGEVSAPPPRQTLVPSLSEGLRRQLHELAAQGQLPPLQILEESPGELPRLLADHAHARFLLPRSMVTGRLCRSQAVEVQPLGPQVRSAVVAHYEPDDAVAGDLVQAIAGRLQEPERNIVFRPQLTIRQIRCHQVLHRWRNITAAARSLSVAQPSVTEQLCKTERLLGLALFDRQRRGLQPTAAGNRLNTVAGVIEEGMRRLMVQRASINGMRENVLRLGVLPSSDSGSLLLQCLADALAEWQSAHLCCRLKVIEGPSSHLQDLVVKGTLGLALVEREISELARLNLDPGEPLSLIANPQFGLFAPGEEIDLAEAVRLPLLVPTSVSGIRQLLDAGAGQAGLRLNIASEVNSMALTVALLARQAACTVLPASAVQRYLDSGELVHAPIRRPAILRRFHAIYSADRTLSEPERDFVRALRRQFDLRRHAPAAPRRVARGQGLAVVPA